MRPTFLLPLLLAPALACSGSGATGSPPSPTAAPSTTLPTPGAAIMAPIPPSFAELLKLSAGVAYKVTYKVSGAANGQRVEMDQTIYSHLPRTRTDIAIPSGPAAGTSSMYMLEDGNYMCADAGSGKNCLRLPASSNAAARGNPVDLLSNQPGQFAAQETNGRQIAGRSARCFNVTPKAGSTWRSALLCFSIDGIPLLTSVTADTNDAVTMEATSVATVADADFALPGPVVAFPGADGVGSLPAR